MGAPVSLEVSDGVALVRLDSPPANAIDFAMGRALHDAIVEAEGNPEVGAIVVWGGPKIFAAGADVRAMATWGPEEVRPSVEMLGGVCDLLETIDTVSIAAVNGYALGGGLELALGCDLRYLAADATIGQPEIKLGVIPGAGGTQRLVRLLGPGRTRELVYTGRFVAADEALALGLAETVVPPGHVLETALTDAKAIARGPRQALAAAKAAIQAAVETPGGIGVRTEREAFLALFGTPDQREGMAAFLDKREPHFGA